MESKYRVVEALLAKTVERGATPHEAASARAKAEQIIAAHGLDRSRIGGQPGAAKSTFRWSGADPWAGFGPTSDPFHNAAFAADFIRRAAEHMRRRRHGPGNAGGTRRKEQWETKEYDGIGDMARELLSARFNIRQRGRLVAEGVGVPYSEVLRRVKVRFPSATTTVNSLRWYEAQLRRTGKTVPKRWDPTKRRAAPDRGQPR